MNQLYVVVVCSLMVCASFCAESPVSKRTSTAPTTSSTTATTSTKVSANATNSANATAENDSTLTYLTNNMGPIKRAFYVFIGVSAIIALYFGIRVYR